MIRDPDREPVATLALAGIIPIDCSGDDAELVQLISLFSLSQQHLTHFSLTLVLGTSLCYLTSARDTDAVSSVRGARPTVGNPMCGQSLDTFQDPG